MITLKNVSKWYGHFQVLTDCSTEVKKGEVGWSRYNRASSPLMVPW